MAATTRLPAKRNIAVYIGDTYEHVITMTDADDEARVVTGYTYTSQIRQTVDSASATLSFTVTVTDGAAGEITVSATAAATAALTKGEYVWDLQETSDTGVVTTLLVGRCTITRDVTR